MIEVEELNLGLYKNDGGYYCYNNKEFKYIEEVAIYYYEKNGYKGIYTQNAYWWHLFSFLFWDEIFSIIDLKYSEEKYTNNEKSFNKFNYLLFSDMPKDFFTKDFLKNREEMISYKMNLIREKGAKIILEKNYFKAKKLYDITGTSFRLVEVFDRYSLEDLKIIFDYIDINYILKIMLYFMSDVSKNRSGFPDIMIYNKNVLEFLEIKGKNDVIRENQVKVLYILNNNNIKSKICTIDNSDRKINNLKNKLFDLKYETRVETISYINFLKKAKNRTHTNYIEEYLNIISDSNKIKKNSNKTKVQRKLWYEKWWGWILVFFFWIFLIPIVVFDKRTNKIKRIVFVVFYILFIISLKNKGS